MTIDDTGKNTLTRQNEKVVMSDHRMLKLEIDLMFHIDKKHERTEVFNLKTQVANQGSLSSHPKITDSPNVSLHMMNNLIFSSKSGNTFMTTPVSEK